MGLERKKTKSKLLKFEVECKEHYSNLLAGFKQIDWPARKTEIENYIHQLNTFIKQKKFDRVTAKLFLSQIKGFLFLYRSITGGDLKMTKLPGEHLLHSSVKKINKRMTRKDDIENKEKQI